MDHITLSTNPPSDRPSYGFIQITWDAANGALGIRDPSGTLTPISTVTRPTVTPATIADGGVVTGLPLVDETHWVQCSEAMTNARWDLPAASDSVVGQIKLFVSDQDIPSLSVIIHGDDDTGVIGASLSAATQYEAYSFQCVSTLGAGQWLRIA